MKIKFKTRFGKEVEIEKKERVFYILPGESFQCALVRTYYPAVYRRLRKIALDIDERLARQAGGEAVMS